MAGKYKFVEGERYSFNLVEDEGVFYVRAIDKRTKRCAFVNNLEPLLARLRAVAGKVAAPRFKYSWWYVNAEDGNRLFAKALESFASKDFVANLERELDEDRKLEEWQDRTE